MVNVCYYVHTMKITGLTLKQFILSALFLVCFGIVVFFVVTSGLFATLEKKIDATKHDAQETDSERLSALPGDFGSVADFFSNLSIEKGGVYAYELLANSQLPPNIDTHLLGHIIGDNLYKQEGLEGMKYCTQNFRNACSHAIVIGALLNEGIGVFDRVNDVCRQAPGAGMAYGMCFHGFGHGVLAFVEYELPDAITLCEKVGTPEYHYYEFNECVGGAIMEMRGGIHDPVTWRKKAEKYLDFKDPLAMCEQDFMPDSVKEICYIYITPFIFDAVGAGELPTDKEFAAAFRYCDAVLDEKYRTACYGGFGKEFVVLVQGRDVRKIGELNDGQFRDIIHLCTLAENSEGVTECLKQITDSLFWGGEYDSALYIRFCSLMDGDAEQQDKCYLEILRNVGWYSDSLSVDYKASLCSALPEVYKSDCLSIEADTTDSADK